MMGDLGKTLVVIGLVMTAVGIVLMLAGRVPWLGRLPGDIYVQRGNWSFYFPVVTSLVLSVLLTLLFWLFGRR
jgi:membrane protein implicated in regulation of membrane protease activity